MRSCCTMAVALWWCVLAAGCQPAADQTAPPMDTMDQPVRPADDSGADDQAAAGEDQPSRPAAATTSQQDGSDANDRDSVQYDPGTGDLSVKESGKPEQPEPKQPAPQTRQRAQAGVGKRGQGYGGGIVSEPARVYFNVRERVVFQVQIPQALNTYKALDPQGKGPQSHEEFMQQVIKANGLTLPDLPAGFSYQYDPKTEELMVEGARQ